VQGCNEEHQANQVLESLIGVWHRYEIPLSSLNLNKVSSLVDEDLDKIKIKSEDIECCINTILKEAPNEQIAVRQLFVGLCSSATHIPQNNIIVLSNMTPKALFHDQGIIVIKDPETGEYEKFEQIIDGIDTEIEEKQEEIENAKEKQQKKELKKEIKSLERQKQHIS